MKTESNFYLFLAGSKISSAFGHTHTHIQWMDMENGYYLLFIEVEGGIDIYGSVESGARD